MAEITLATLPAKFRAAVKTVAGPVKGLARELGVAREKASKLAPRVIKLFNDIRAEAEGRFTLAQFARLFDANVPERAEDYRRNRTYQALDYMQRIQRAADRPKGQQGKRDPATDQLARVVGMVLTVKGIDADAIYSTFAQQFGLEKRGVEALKRRVAATKPLMDLSHVAVAKGAGKVIQMERAATGDQVERMRGVVDELNARQAKGKRAAA